VKERYDKEMVESFHFVGCKGLFHAKVSTMDASLEKISSLDGEEFPKNC
jgi:hypothetical protein